VALHISIHPLSGLQTGNYSTFIAASITYNMKTITDAFGEYCDIKTIPLATRIAINVVTYIAT
jgi:hypothetical protein